MKATTTKRERRKIETARLNMKTGSHPSQDQALPAFARLRSAW
jgi:hypothetical protein